MQNNLFKKSSMDRITSPEKLNDFIKVSNPTSWMIVGAALSIVLGLLCWGIFGKLNESVVFNGYMKDNQLYCYLDGSLSQQLESGMQAVVTPQGSGESYAGCILSIADHPLSFDEVSRGIPSDYMLSSLGITGWNIAVVVESDAPLYEGVVYSVSVVTDTYRPIEMVFR